MTKSNLDNAIEVLTEYRNKMPEETIDAVDFIIYYIKEYIPHVESRINNTALELTKIWCSQPGTPVKDSRVIEVYKNFIKELLKHDTK